MESQDRGRPSFFPQRRPSSTLSPTTAPALTSSTTPSSVSPPLTSQAVRLSAPTPPSLTPPPAPDVTRSLLPRPTSPPPPPFTVITMAAFVPTTAAAAACAWTPAASAVCAKRAAAAPAAAAARRPARRVRAGRVAVVAAAAKPVDVTADTFDAEVMESVRNVFGPPSLLHWVAARELRAVQGVEAEGVGGVVMMGGEWEGALGQCAWPAVVCSSVGRDVAACTDSPQPVTGRRCPIPFLWAGEGCARVTGVHPLAAGVWRVACPLPWRLAGVRAHTGAGQCRWAGVEAWHADASRSVPRGVGPL